MNILILGLKIGFLRKCDNFCAKFALFSASFYFCDILRIICAWSGTSFAQYSASYATSFAQFCAKSKIPQNLRKTQYFVQELHPAS